MSMLADWLIIQLVNEQDRIDAFARKVRCDGLNATPDGLFARKIHEYELKIMALRTFRRHLRRKKMKAEMKCYRNLYFCQEQFAKLASIAIGRRLNWLND